MSTDNKSGQPNWKRDTMAAHGGFTPCKATGASCPPIYQSTSYVFDSSEQAADLFHARKAGYIYSRITNPTVQSLEEKIALLEGGTGAACTASGLAANTLVFSSLMNTGDEFVASQKIYGGTTSQFRDSFSRAFGWKCTFVDPRDPEQYKSAITEKTKILYVESLSNPEGVIADIEKIARIAEEAHIPLIVDNTIATPFLCRPLDYGASIVTHSTTKYLSGQGQAMGGIIVDGGTFNWMANADRYPTLAQTDPSYNLIFAKEFAEAPLAMHMHAVGLRDLGMNQQAMNAFLTLLGTETLALRMERHSKNAQAVAEFLSRHDLVSWVNYAGLPDNPCHMLAQKYMYEGMCSSLFTFGVTGGYEMARAVVENTQLFTHLANIGDTKSLIIHPASTTHSELTEEHKIKAGALPEALRISVGIENPDDLIADLDQALRSAQKMAA